MENVTLVSIDLAKNVFQTRAVNHNGRAIREKRVSRERLVEEICRYPKGTPIAMEACGGANHWARTIEELGYKALLIAPQHVKPFVTNQKHDRADAQGIAEAASRASTRFIPVKSIEQQDLQCLHRAREKYVTDRTASMNNIRGLLAEYGMVMARGKDALLKSLPEVLEHCTPTLKRLVYNFLEDLAALEKRINQITKEIEAIGKSNDACARLVTIPGVGMLTATAIYSSLAHMKFKNGRQCAAYIGLTPRHSCSGESSKLGHITKAGNKYLRKLLVHGARSVLRTTDNCVLSPYKSWAKEKKQSKGYCKAAVALANKNARIAWNILTRDTTFSGKTPWRGAASLRETLA